MFFFYPKWKQVEKWVAEKAGPVYCKCLWKRGPITVSEKSFVLRFEIPVHFPWIFNLWAPLNIKENLLSNSLAAKDVVGRREFGIFLLIILFKILYLSSG